MAVEAYHACLSEAQKQGGKLICGGEPVQHTEAGLKGGNWVSPAIVYHGAKHPSVMEEETFAPVLRERSRDPFLVSFRSNKERH